MLWFQYGQFIIERHSVTTFTGRYQVYAKRITKSFDFCYNYLKIRQILNPSSRSTVGQRVVLISSAGVSRRGCSSNAKVGGSSPPGSNGFFLFFLYVLFAFFFIYLLLLNFRVKNCLNQIYFRFITRDTCKVGGVQVSVFYLYTLCLNDRQPVKVLKSLNDRQSDIFLKF